MKNKKLLQLVSLIMCLSVVPSTAVFAETGEPETEEKRAVGILF